METIIGEIYRLCMQVLHEIEMYPSFVMAFMTLHMELLWEPIHGDKCPTISYSNPYADVCRASGFWYPRARGVT